MAVVNTKATNISNLDASPPVLNHVNTMNGILREQVATAAIAAADDNDSVYRMARVHSSWRISELTLFNDAIASGTDFDLGLYRTLEDGGLVVDANAYSDAVSVASGNLTGVQHLFEAGGAKGLEKIEDFVWKDAGLTADPSVWYDIALTAFIVGTAAGDVSLRTRYVANT